MNDKSGDLWSEWQIYTEILTISKQLIIVKFLLSHNNDQLMVLSLSSPYWWFVSNRKLLLIFKPLILVGKEITGASRVANEKRSHLNLNSNHWFKRHRNRLLWIYLISGGVSIIPHCLLTFRFKGFFACTKRCNAWEKYHTNFHTSTSMRDKKGYSLHNQIQLWQIPEILYPMFSSFQINLYLKFIVLDHKWNKVKCTEMFCHA